MCKNAGVANEVATAVINCAIEEMCRKNPQESHFVRQVCAEIRNDIKKFTSDMITLYGTELGVIELIPKEEQGVNETKS
jgi:hypothetical protein